MIEDIIPAIIIISLLSLVAAYICVPANKYKLIFTVIAFTAVLLRFAVVFYLYRNGTHAFGTDGLLYHQEGIKIAGRLNEGVSLFEVSYSYTWYTVFIGLVYYLFGINRYIGSFINIFFAFAAGMILLRIALNHKYNFTNAALISLAFLYFPNLVLWTADTRKESLLILVCFVGWLSVQSFIMNVGQNGRLLPNILRIAFICLLMWFSTLIRIYMSIPLLFGIVTSQIILYRKKRRKICLIFAAAAAVSAVVIFATAMYPLTRDYHAVTFPEEQTGSVVDDIGNKIAVVEAIASKRNILESVLDYLVLPYPGNINIADIKGSRKAQLFVRIDMTAWYVCLLLILTGIYTAFKERDCCFIGLLAFIATYVLINAMLVENVSDTIYRYRSVIVGLSMLFIDGNVIRGLLKRFNAFVNRDTTGGYTFRL